MILLIVLINSLLERQLKDKYFLDLPIIGTKIGQWRYAGDWNLLPKYIKWKSLRFIVLNKHLLTIFQNLKLVIIFVIYIVFFHICRRNYICR